MKTRPPRNTKPPEAATIEWRLHLYVAGPSRKSSNALRNLERICKEHLAGHYQIEVIDLVKNPQFARDEQILAVPTVVRKRPPPSRKIIGDLANTERVMSGLDLRPNYLSPVAAVKAAKGI